MASVITPISPPALTLHLFPSVLVHANVTEKTDIYIRLDFNQLKE